MDLPKTHHFVMAFMSLGKVTVQLPTRILQIMGQHVNVVPVLFESWKLSLNPAVVCVPSWVQTQR
ncbi:hypothetical protein F441_04129 [Phytophthora nicotianae CJ01A1]|uniref:Uncharacterized protein n=3 Tax=Phytophthora nicotianae TaxID=4792 RepID=W2ZTF7_PHYNI|nr:hypothetical protein L915_04038 [Phytophthora nicotianae]ETL46062.1 hypothetical protein L916_03984 [Phytophthora nicotianae]ETP22623.1 hypothetical protein F441_04129 [Phytophthora nicotianae CJ01A1]ETP50593.1 hypothetical protein F442_04145 [Phytophthora nicotianae P10297]